MARSEVGTVVQTPMGLKQDTLTARRRVQVPAEMQTGETLVFWRTAVARSLGTFSGCYADGSEASSTDAF